MDRIPTQEIKGKLDHLKKKSTMTDFSNVSKPKFMSLHHVKNYYLQIENTQNWIKQKNKNLNIK